MQYKTIEAINFKEVDTQRGIVQGYLSAFNNVDAHNDVILPGAFKKTIQERGLTGIKFLLNHDTGKPIGTFQKLQEDNNGLFYEAKVGSHAIGKDFLAMAMDGMITNHSIGFITVKEEKRKDANYLKELKLFEGSALTFFGANEKTPLLSIKSLFQAQERITLLLKTYRNSSFNSTAFELMEGEIIYWMDRLSLTKEPVIDLKNNNQNSLDESNDEIVNELKELNKLFSTKPYMSLSRT